MNLKDDEETSLEFVESDGPLFIESVRHTIDRYLTTKRAEIAKRVLFDHRFQRKMGCFVTLKLNDIEKSLRGCIGFSEPIYPLSSALTNAAIYAATQDPRFDPVLHSELDGLLVEVSVLSRPQRISAASSSDMLAQVRVGTDGLVMKWESGTGLLLPQVARDFNWTARDFLQNLGTKAGAGINQWLNPGTQIYRFQAKVFEEISPHGKVKLS